MCEKIVGPSWGVNWFSKANASSSQMIDIDPLYTHVVISFVQPDIAYVKNSNSFQGTGIGFSATFGAVKEAVKLLKAKNVKVLLAVGGATYNNWTALANNTGAHRQALVDLVTDLGLDGLDVDYEINGTDDGNIVQYYKSIKVLYSITTNNKASIMFTVLFRFTYSDYSILYLQSFTNISVITFQFSIMETVMASFIDEYAFVLRKNWINSAIFRFTVCMSFYLLALPMTTRVCTILH